MTVTTINQQVNGSRCAAPVLADTSRAERQAAFATPTEQFEAPNEIKGGRAADCRTSSREQSEQNSR